VKTASLNVLKIALSAGGFFYMSEINSIKPGTKKKPAEAGFFTQADITSKQLEQQRLEQQQRPKQQEQQQQEQQRQLELELVLELVLEQRLLEQLLELG
jgi:hypothetical protein